MTKDEIRYEMKLRIEEVGAIARLALWEIAFEDFSGIAKHLEDIKMYAERAHIDLDASYLAQ